MTEPNDARVAMVGLENLDAGVGGKRAAENMGRVRAGCSYCERPLRPGEPMKPGWHFFGSGKIICPECYPEHRMSPSRDVLQRWLEGQQ
jgi:hypothetical protein